MAAGMESVLMEGGGGRGYGGGGGKPYGDGTVMERAFPKEFWAE